MSMFSGQISNPKAWSSKTPRGYQTGFLQQFSPEQMQLFQQMFGQVGPESFLSKLAAGGDENFEEMEAPAWRNFNQAQGQIASRFSGMGGGQGQRMLSTQKSSGFRNTMGQLGSEFAQDLASKRMGLQQQAVKDLMGLSSDLLGQRPYDQFMAQKGPSNIERFMNIYAPMAQGAMKAGMGGM